MSHQQVPTIPLPPTQTKKMTMKQTFETKQLIVIYNKNGNKIIAITGNSLFTHIGFISL